MQDNSLHRKHFYTQTLLHTKAFTHRSFYTQKLLHRRFYTQSFYPQKLLHTEAFTYRSFYIQKLLHTDAFTQILLHTDTFTHRHFCTQTLLHTGAAFTHKRLYTQKFLHSLTYLFVVFCKDLLCISYTILAQGLSFVRSLFLFLSSQTTVCCGGCMALAAHILRFWRFMMSTCPFRFHTFSHLIWGYRAVPGDMAGA